jgi:cytochrome b561
VRLCTARPAPEGSPLLHRLAALGHFGLYAVVFLMIGTGWFTGFLVSSVFAHPGAHLPDSLVTLPSFQAHALLAVLLTVLIAVHVAAALYHQLVLKDGLFGRMGFGRRTVVPRA